MDESKRYSILIVGVLHSLRLSADRILKTLGKRFLALQKGVLISSFRKEQNRILAYQRKVGDLTTTKNADVTEELPLDSPDLYKTVSVGDIMGVQEYQN